MKYFYRYVSEFCGCDECDIIEADTYEDAECKASDMAYDSFHMESDFPEDLDRDYYFELEEYKPKEHDEYFD